jgi:hypothetical protein
MIRLYFHRQQKQPHNLIHLCNSGSDSTSLYKGTTMETIGSLLVSEDIEFVMEKVQLLKFS